MLKIPSFEIFRGTFPDTDVVWIESVGGLAAAHKRMHEIASESPGGYFVFRSKVGMLAQVDNSIPGEDTVKSLHSITEANTPQFALSRACLLDAQNQITEMLRTIESPHEVSVLVEALGLVEQAIEVTGRILPLQSKPTKAAQR